MKKRLGDILLARGVLDMLQLQSALAYQRKWGVPLGQVVVDQRFCAPEVVFAALAEQAGVAPVDLDAQPPEPALARLIPEKVAEAHRVVPLRLEGGPRDTVLVVAIAAPASMASLDVVKSVSGKGRVVARLATDAAIRRAIGRLYRGETGPAPRRPGFEGFALPEADDAMPVVVGESMAELTNMESPAEAESSGLPLLAPLDEEPAVTRGPLEQVLVYGWGAAAAAGLVRVLGDAGLLAKVVSTDELLAASEAQVVVAPLPSLEPLGRRVRAQVVVAGKTPELDLPRAQAVGARGFLAAPVDPDLMLRAVRRLARSADDAFVTRAGRAAPASRRGDGAEVGHLLGHVGQPEGVELQRHAGERLRAHQ